MQATRLCLLLLLLVTVPAGANWQYTKWGMTPAQVVAASHGAATETTPAQQAGERISATGEVALLTAPWQAGRFRFTALFFFSTGRRLTHVTLNLETADPSDGDRLLGSLRQKYGAAFSSKANDFFTMEIWHYQGDQVSYTAAAGKLFNLQYGPLKNADNSAL
jgi:hypothetical protein